MVTETRPSTLDAAVEEARLASYSQRGSAKVLVPWVRAATSRVASTEKNHRQSQAKLCDRRRVRPGGPFHPLGYCHLRKSNGQTTWPFKQYSRVQIAIHGDFIQRFPKEAGWCRCAAVGRGTIKSPEHQTYLRGPRSLCRREPTRCQSQSVHVPRASPRRLQTSLSRTSVSSHRNRTT